MTHPHLAPWTPTRTPVGDCHVCGQPCLTVDEWHRPCHVGCWPVVRTVVDAVTQNGLL
jgi:hypothetical protein